MPKKYNTHRVARTSNKYFTNQSSLRAGRKKNTTVQNYYELSQRATCTILIWADFEWIIIYQNRNHLSSHWLLCVFHPISLMQLPTLWIWIQKRKREKSKKTLSSLANAQCMVGDYEYTCWMEWLNFNISMLTILRNIHMRRHIDTARDIEIDSKELKKFGCCFSPSFIFSLFRKRWELLYFGLFGIFVPEKFKISECGDETPRDFHVKLCEELQQRRERKIAGDRSKSLTMPRFSLVWKAVMETKKWKELIRVMNSGK